MNTITLTLCASTRTGCLSAPIHSCADERLTLAGDLTLSAGTSVALLTPRGNTLAHTILSEECAPGATIQLSTITAQAAEYTRSCRAGDTREALLAIGDSEHPFALIPARIAQNPLYTLAPPADLAPAYPTTETLKSLLAEMQAASNAAAQSATAARKSAEEAGESASSAASDRATAVYAATSAQAYSEVATAAQARSSTSASEASTSAANAASSASAARDAASSSISAENSAAGSAAKAAASADSASFALTAATNAANRAEVAAEKAHDADISAASSAAAAKQSATSAAQEAAENVTALLQGKVDAAEAARAGAEAAKTASETAARNAATSYADTAAIMKNQEYLEIPNMSSLPSYALAGNTLVKRIRQIGVPQANLTSYLMACCFNLEEFNVIDEIWYWGEGVFSNCWKLKTITCKRKSLQICSKSLFDRCYELSPAYVASLCNNFTKDFRQDCCRDLGKNLAEAEPFDLGVSIERTFVGGSLYGANISYFRAKIARGNEDFALGNNTTLKEIDLTFSSSVELVWQSFFNEARGLEKVTFRTSEAERSRISSLFASSRYNGFNSSVVDIYFPDWTQAVAESHFYVVGLGATSSKYHFHFSDTPEGEYITYA